MVTPMPVSLATIRYSEPRKSSLNSGASASSNPDKESITRRFACIRSIISIKSCKVSSIDKSRERVSITPTFPVFTSEDSLVLSSWLGLFSNAAMTPGSPLRAPSARNSVAKMVFPEPDGPTTSSEYPTGKPPPSMSSRPGVPMETRSSCADNFFADSTASPCSIITRGKTSIPRSLIRNVCKPGACA